MAVGNKVLAALSQIDEAISSEADDLANLIASNDSIDDETSKLLLERVARIKSIVPEKAPAVGEAADDGTAQPPAENPVADAQTPPSVGDATDAPGNADVPGDGVNGETGTGTPA